MRRDFLGRLATVFIAMVSLLALNSCDSQTEPANNKLTIVATTGMIGDALRIIAGDSATVISLMGPGVDPHLYKPTQRDIQALSDADIIFYNGLHLEGKMGEIMHQMAESKSVVAISDGIDVSELHENENFQGNYDPHIWFNTRIWIEAVKHAETKLVAEDPKNSTYYHENATTYLDNLTKLDEWVQAQMQLIPDSQRVLITAHDAFGYFGSEYGAEVRGLQGLSTAAEYGLKDVTNLVDFIVGRSIKSVFIESSVSDKSLRAVIEGCAAKGHTVRIGGTLFSDAMGEVGTEEGTYIGMVKHNVNTIVDALK